MLHTVSPLVLTLSLFALTSVATHFAMSFGQTLIHYKVAHHRMGGKIFRNHNNFHHTHYSEAHLVSQTYLGDEGNTTPYFFIPVLPAAVGVYLLLPLDLFLVAVVTCAASFYAHILFDNEYHLERSRLQRFAWFRRKQALHFVHHRHADSNFAVIHFFWIGFSVLIEDRMRVRLTTAGFAIEGMRHRIADIAVRTRAHAPQLAMSLPRRQGA